jgi:hypothetical protein
MRSLPASNKEMLNYSGFLTNKIFRSQSSTAYFAEDEGMFCLEELQAVEDVCR